MSVSEKIVQSTLLQAVARVAMALTLPLLLLGVGYLSALGQTVNAHTTDIALLQQQDAEQERRMEKLEEQSAQILSMLQQLSTDSETTKRDVGYLRDWVEELKRAQKVFQ